MFDGKPMNERTRSTTVRASSARLRCIAFVSVAIVGIASAPICHALSVTQPTAASVVPAGDDYATQVLGNPWDMNDAADIETQESFGVTGQTFSAGLYTANTTANGAFIYPLFMGYPQTINLSRGANSPIDTSRYRYVTIKLRATQPPATIQFARVVFLDSGNSYNDGTFGYSAYSTLLANQWMIITFDMIGQIDGTSPHHWTDFPQVPGLRIDPATTNAGGAYASVQFNIDWIRLTAPASAAQKTTVQWTDSPVSTYKLAAVDSGGTSFSLTNSVSGTSFQADLSFLPPGQYHIQVSRTDNSATANSATFAINSPPQPALTAPAASGDLSKDFATTVVGNPWGPIEAADFVPGIGVRNFTNVSYSNPVGSFNGRPLNNDTGWFFNLNGHAIDASLYRSLCFALEVFGPRNVGTGSVARVFWGNATGALTTSQQLTLDDNNGDTTVGRYCIADLAAYAPDPADPPNGGTWSGSKTVFRIDPDEFTPPGGCSTADTCHDVRLDAVTLAPFAQANPSYTFRWNLSDLDDANVNLSLYLDPDTNPGNANELLVYSATVANGSGQFAWPDSREINYGTYHVLALATDSKNSVSQYASGPLIAGALDGIFRNGFEVP